MDKKKISLLTKAGDICQTCRPQWTHQKLEPKRYQSVLDAHNVPATTDYGIPIIACAFCDGELIFSLPKSPQSDITDKTDK